MEQPLFELHEETSRRLQMFRQGIYERKGQGMFINDTASLAEAFEWLSFSLHTKNSPLVCTLMQPQLIQAFQESLRIVMRGSHEG